MRICIDVSAAVHGRAGLGRYAQELTAAISEMDCKNEYITFYNHASQANLKPPIDRLQRITSLHSNKPWRMRVLLAHLAGLAQDRLFPDIDLFHATDHLLPRFYNIKSVFTVNDLTFSLYPKTHRSWNRLFLQLMMPRFLRTANAIIAISDCTRRDVSRVYGLDPEKIQVIYDGVHPHFHPVQEGEKQAVCRKYSLPEQYLLNVGTIEPRKNLNTLLEAYHLIRQRGINLPLVIAGKKGWRSEGFFKKRRLAGLEEQVQWAGFVSDNDLPAIYSGASAFIFPSLYEGFGLPVLEAMACGTPVICSNVSSLPEIAGEAALMFDPCDPDALAGAIARVLTDGALNQELRELGYAQAARFTWEQTARKTLAVYEQAAG